MHSLPSVKLYLQSPCQSQYQPNMENSIIIMSQYVAYCIRFSFNAISWKFIFSLVFKSRFEIDVINITARELFWILCFPYCSNCHCWLPIYQGYYTENGSMVFILWIIPFDEIKNRSRTLFLISSNQMICMGKLHNPWIRCGICSWIQCSIIT